MKARHASMPHAKVAEYHPRGTIALHALIRMDGPKNDDRSADPPGWVTPAMPAEHNEAAHRVTLSAPPPVAGDPARNQRYVRQPGALPVAISSTAAHSLDGQPPTAEHAAGYVAKYASKSRRSSITLGRLRRPRSPARPPGRPSRPSRPTPGRGRPRSPPARRSQRR